MITGIGEVGESWKAVGGGRSFAQTQHLLGWGEWGGSNTPPPPSDPKFIVQKILFYKRTY